jgi:hypothetical protein
MEQHPAPLFAEVVDEFAEAISAVIDGFIALLVVPPNMERMAAVIQRLEDVRDAVREMRDQEATE